MTPTVLHFFTSHKEHVTDRMYRETRRTANQLIKVNRSYAVTAVATP